MRPIEIIILLAIAAWFLVPPRLQWLRQILAFVGLVAIPWHLAIEGFRWQMVPAYALLSILAAAAWWSFIGNSSGKPNLGTAVLGSLAALGAIALPVIFPIPRFPTPNGNLAVGSTTMHLVDEGRTERYGDIPGDPRQLMMQIYYPATPGPDAEPAAWLDHPGAIAGALTKANDLPSFVLDHLEYTTSNTYPDAPVSDTEDAYPVVVYSHGWTGFRVAGANQAETLASEGFIVVTVDHTYASAMTVLPDGRQLAFDPQALPDEDEVGEEAHAAAATKLMEVYIDDLRFVVDTLAQINRGGFDTSLTGRLDLTRLGLYGHSLGGGAVAGFCQADARCTAGLGFDPWVEPLPSATIDQGLNVPFAFVRSEEWVGNDNDIRLRRFYDAGKADHYWHSIQGTVHRDFVFVPLVSPVGGLLGISGQTNPGRVVDILDEELTAFFGKYLRGEDPAFLLNPRSAFEEVTAESR